MNDMDLSSVEEALKTKNEVAVKTRGRSMRPMLRQGRDVVIIERVNRELKVGDVPLYHNNRKNQPFILHRILKVLPDMYLIRGDNTYEIEHVKKDRVIGVMKCFYREGKYHDCATDKGYKAYIIYNRLNYPFRYVDHIWIRPFWRKVRKIFFKKYR